jgi:hypothetical protein
MKHNVELLTGLDVRPLLDKLEAMPKLWKEITLRQDYPGSAHGDTECIFIRGPEAFTPEKYFNDLGSYNYPASLAVRDEIAPLLNAVAGAVDMQEMGRILIVKLKPGGHVKEHSDEGSYADYFSRFHIVLATNPQCTNTTGGESDHWPVGTAWWFNHKQMHTADNGGDTDRIHIIVDAVSTLFPVGGALPVN